MTRPSPIVYETFVLDKVREKKQEVVSAYDTFVVLYKGEVFNLRTSNPYTGLNKYGKTMFPNPGNAFRLADTLNRRFDTTDFTVGVPVQMREVKREDYYEPRSAKTKI